MNKDLRKKIGQCFFIGIAGTKLSEEEKTFIVDNDIGGIILFSRNCESPKQIHSLCTEIQSLRHKTKFKLPFFIGIDMEGGRVARLKAPFTQWPPVKNLGDMNSPSLSFQFAYNMGLELRAVGINVNFAPTVDVLTNPTNKAIGDRALSSDPDIVGKNASAIVRGYLKSNIISCAKHFPGHGNTIIDSHDDLPIEDLSLERLEEIEISAFKKAFRARVDMVMMSHIKYNKVDDKYPASLSEKMIRGVLRDTGFKKLVITDDLDMGALANHYAVADIPVLALKAGVNILLYCNKPDSHKIALDAVEQAVLNASLSSDIIDENFALIEKVKNESLDKLEPVSIEDMVKIVGHPEHLSLARAIAAKEIPPDINN